MTNYLGIPYPAFTSVLGHAEKMIHYYKHEFRLHVMNTIGHPVHQVSLVFEIIRTLVIAIIASVINIDSIFSICE